MKFKEFKDNWSNLDHTKFNTLQFNLGWLNSIKVEVEQKLELIQSNNNFIRDDYKEVLELVTAVLNLPRAKPYKLKKPGAYHHARWMAEVLYCLKMFVWCPNAILQVDVRETAKSVSIYCALLCCSLANMHQCCQCFCK